MVKRPRMESRLSTRLGIAVAVIIGIIGMHHMVVVMCSTPAHMTSTNVAETHAHAPHVSQEEPEVIRVSAAEAPADSDHHPSLAHLCLVIAMALALFMPTMKARYNSRNRLEVNRSHGQPLNLRAPPQKDLLCISRT
jgi:hypothetical protein